MGALPGAAWRDLPERFGPWSTMYQRYRGWRNQGTFDQLLKRLYLSLNEQGLIDLQTLMIDSTAVRATRASSGAGKKRAGRTCRSRSRSGRGGLATRTHMLCDAKETLLRFFLSGGQGSDISYAQPLLDEVSTPSSQRRRQRKRCNWLG
ncbi:IS5 family transposase [Pseudomonas putida]|uniref:IS5 family transposase n=1 Tax=Pseudomonas putida TaxID=303 RepID=UPI003C6E1345